MTKTLGLILFLITFLASGISYGQTKVKPYPLNCLAVNGLMLRQAPNQKGEKITTIPYGGNLRVTETTGKKERIKGFMGEWVKVTYNDTSGYAFNAFLSTYTAPVLRTQGYSYLFDYLVKNYKLTEGIDSFDVDKADMGVFNESFEFDNISYNYNNEGHDAIETILLPNNSIEESFIVYASCVWMFRKYEFDRTQFKKETNEDGSVVYKSYDLKDPENSAEGLIYSYTLDNEGEYLTMHIEFEWESGGSWFHCEKLPHDMVKISHGYYSH